MSRRTAMKRDVPCRGLRHREISRRAFLETTVAAGTAGLSLPAILAAQARAEEPNPRTNDPAVIQIWLGGGPTQFETYDPKPGAPAEYRGPFQAIPTKLPGVQVCELLPRHADIMDKVAILRSVHHDSGDH